MTGPIAQHNRVEFSQTKAGFIQQRANHWHQQTRVGAFLLLVLLKYCVVAQYGNCASQRRCVERQQLHWVLS